MSSSKVFEFLQRYICSAIGGLLILTYMKKTMTGFPKNIFLTRSFFFSYAIIQFSIFAYALIPKTVCRQNFENVLYYIMANTTNIICAKFQQNQISSCKVVINLTQEILTLRKTAETPRYTHAEYQNIHTKQGH